METASTRRPRELDGKTAKTTGNHTFSASWRAHQDHEPRVDVEENVQAGFTRYAVVCSEVALPAHDLVVASKRFEGNSRGRRKHLRSPTQEAICNQLPPR